MDKEFITIRIAQQEEYIERVRQNEKLSLPRKAELIDSARIVKSYFKNKRLLYPWQELSVEYQDKTITLQEARRLEDEIKTVKVKGV